MGIKESKMVPGAVPISHLGKHVKQLMSKSKHGGDGFSVEWASIVKKSQRDGPCDFVEETAHLRPRNRYRDILPFLSSQVHIKPFSTPVEEGGDYINASYIDGLTKRAYIASQGPLEETVVHFWQMVWEQDVTVMVMVTRLVEGARQKCFQYWPSPDDQPQVVGPFRVTTRLEGNIENNKHLVRRELLLEVIDDAYADGCSVRQRTVHHFQYIEWPDHGAPDSSDTFRLLMHTVDNVFQAVKAFEPATDMVIELAAMSQPMGVFPRGDDPNASQQLGLDDCPDGRGRDEGEASPAKVGQTPTWKGRDSPNPRLDASTGRVGLKSKTRSSLPPEFVASNKASDDPDSATEDSVDSDEPQPRRGKGARKVSAGGSGGGGSGSGGTKKRASSGRNGKRGADDDGGGGDDDNDDDDDDDSTDSDNSVDSDNVPDKSTPRQPAGFPGARPHASDEGDDGSASCSLDLDGSVDSDGSDSDSSPYMLNAYRNHHLPDPVVPPLLIHCSAGIGRTGTWCTIHTISHQLRIALELSRRKRLDREPVIDLVAFVLSLRHQRVGMVQTMVQYKFCYEAIAREYEGLTGQRILPKRSIFPPPKPKKKGKKKRKGKASKSGKKGGNMSKPKGSRVHSGSSGGSGGGGSNGGSGGSGPSIYDSQRGGIGVGRAHGAGTSSTDSESPRNGGSSTRVDDEPTADETSELKMRSNASDDDGGDSSNQPSSLSGSQPDVPEHSPARVLNMLTVHATQEPSDHLDDSEYSSDSDDD